MNHTWVAVLQSRTRQQRAVELSAYDLADNDTWIKGKRGGEYKMVGGKKVYKKKGAGGGGKKAPAGGRKAEQPEAGQGEKPVRLPGQDAVEKGNANKAKMKMPPLPMDEVSMEVLPRTESTDWNRALGELEKGIHKSDNKAASEDIETVKTLGNLFRVGSLSGELGMQLSHVMKAAKMSMKKGGKASEFLSSLAKSIHDTAIERGHKAGGDLKKQAIAAVHAIYRLARYL